MESKLSLSFYQNTKLQGVYVQLYATKANTNKAEMATINWSSNIYINFKHHQKTAYKQSTTNSFLLLYKPVSYNPV